MVRFTDVAIIRNVRIPRKSTDKDCRSRTMCGSGCNKQLMEHDRFPIERDVCNPAPGLGRMLPVQAAGSIRASVYSFLLSNHSRK